MSGAATTTAKPKAVPLLKKVPRDASYHQTVVNHRPAQCPNCGSATSRITKVDGTARIVTIRWHFCRKCGQKFISHQEMHRADQ